MTRPLLRTALGLCAMLTLSGCFAMAAGVHQDMQFRSDLPNVEISLDGQTCRAPCTFHIRRQWGTFHMQARQGDRVVAQGPIYRREEYSDRCENEPSARLAIPAFVDGLLILPGIIDLSTGIVAWHPENTVVRDGSYWFEDKCFGAPIQGVVKE